MTRSQRSPQKPKFMDLADRLGISLDASEPRCYGDPLMTHMAFWQRWPRFREREACPGMMRIEARRETTFELVCDVCRFEVVIPAEAPDKAEWLLSRSGLPAFADKPFEPSDETAECRAAVREWAAQPRNDLLPAPAIYGKPGRGKTHLLALVGKTLISKHSARVLFLVAPSFLSQLQSSMGKPSYDEVWSRAVRAEVLLLDDLGAEQATDWRADRIAALVDERYRRALATAVTTNVRPDDWDAAFDARTASRLRGMCFPVELGGPDRRQVTSQSKEDA